MAQLAAAHSEAPGNLQMEGTARFLSVTHKRAGQVPSSIRAFRKVRAEQVQAVASRKVDCLQFCVRGRQISPRLMRNNTYFGYEESAR